MQVVFPNELIHFVIVSNELERDVLLHSSLGKLQSNTKSLKLKSNAQSLFKVGALVNDSNGNVGQGSIILHSIHSTLNVQIVFTLESVFETLIVTKLSILNVTGTITLNTLVDVVYITLPSYIISSVSGTD